MGEHRLFQVRAHFVKCLFLSLVDGHGPCYINWKLAAEKPKWYIYVRWSKNHFWYEHSLALLCAKENLCINHIEVKFFSQQTCLITKVTFDV